MSKNSASIAREVTSHPYSTATKFHQRAQESPPKQVDGKWVLGVLQESYGLIHEGKIHPLATSVKGVSIYSLIDSDGANTLLIGCSGKGELAACELELRRILLAQNETTVAIVTDGSAHLFIRRRHDCDRCEYLQDFPQPNSNSFQAEPSKSTWDPADEDSVESLFLDIHSYIRDIDGMHSDEALDELCKVLALALAESDAGFDPSRLAAQHPVLLAHAIRAKYTSLANNARSGNEGEIFSSCIRLSDASLIRAWSSLHESSVLYAPTDLKGRAFQRVLAPAIRAGMGQFFTPSPVVDFIVESMQPKLGDRILDPFCGSGHLLTKSIDSIQSRKDFPESAPEKWIQESFHGIEKSVRMLRIARSDMLLKDGRLTSLHHENALSPFSNYPALKAESFDYVMTNPPFGSFLGKDSFSALGSFELTRGNRRVSTEVLGLERSIQFLRPGGKLGIVLPEGILTNQRLGHVREWLLEQSWPIAIISLPIHTFAPFGANVQTSVLFCIKKIPNASLPEHKVLVGRSESIGYDATGKTTKKASDLTKLADQVSKRFDKAMGDIYVA